MAGHSRPKDDVASLAYVPAISLRDALCLSKRDARHKLALEPAEGRTRVGGHDGGEAANQLQKNAERLKAAVAAAHR
jgi:hypothetical protein